MTMLDRTTNPFFRGFRGKMRNMVTVFDRTTNPFSEVSEGEMRNIVTVLGLQTPFQKFQ